MIFVILLQSCTSQNTNEQLNQIVHKKFQKCEVNDSFVLVKIDCDDCDCGIPINVKYYEQFLEIKDSICKECREGDRYVICDKFCDEYLVECVDSKFTIVHIIDE